MAIDWNHWLKCRTLHEIEVVLLTLGFDPENHQIGYLDGHYLVNKSDLKQKQKDYIKRMGIIEQYRTKSYDYMANDGEWGDCFWANNQKVYVNRFLLWLKYEDRGWDLPNELQAYIEKLDMPSQIQQVKNAKVVEIKPRGRPPKLTAEQEGELVEYYREHQSISHDDLGEKFRVSRKTVGNILKKNGIN